MACRLTIEKSTISLVCMQNPTKNKRTKLLNSVLTERILSVRMKRGDCCIADAVNASAAVFTDRLFSSTRRLGLTQLSVLYAEKLNKMLLGLKREA